MMGDQKPYPDEIETATSPSVATDPPSGEAVPDELLPAEVFEDASHRPETLAASLAREQAARQRLDVLVKISSAVNSSRDLNGIFAVITAEARNIIQFDRASIALLNEDRTLVQVYALSNEEATSLQVGTSMPAAGTVTEWVVEQGEPVISSDLHAESRFVNYPNMLAYGFRSSVSYPLNVRDQKLGTLNFTSRMPNSYSTADLDVIRQLADPIAIAVDNLRLLSIAEKRQHEAEGVAAREEMINRIVSAIRRTLDVEDILHTAAEQLGRHLSVDHCLLYALDDFDLSGTVRASCYASQAGSSGGATWLTTRETIAEELRQGLAVSIPNTSSDTAATTFNVIQRLFNIGALLYVPVSTQDKLTAVIELNQKSARNWEEGEIELVQAVAAHVAVSLNQAQLHHEVIRHSAENARLVNELREANQKLAQVNQLKDEFLANLSHELRTPLTAITAWAELLENLYAASTSLDCPELSEGLYAILNSSSALTQIIEDLIDLSRIQNEMLDLDRAPTDVHALIEEALQMVRNQAKSKQVQLEFNPCPKLPKLLVDGPRIRQVVWNLLSNSIKFTPSSGEVSVATRLRPSGLEIAVRDSGIGIEPAFLPFVFDRFRQEDGSRKRRFRGLGIGLAIVKALVEAHEGKISVQSAGRNRGTCFTIVLPVPPTVAFEETEAPEAQLPEPKPETLEKPSAERKEILVVEDDPQVLRLVGRMVELLGYSPQLADSAASALKLLGSWLPALVLTDINMPDMDGFELLNVLRGSSQTANLPVVALTGFVTVTDMARMEAAQFNGILSKPVRQSQLAEMLQKHIS